MRKYDKHSGIVVGPFEDCEYESHHQHGENGAEGCPVCNPPKKGGLWCSNGQFFPVKM